MIYLVIGFWIVWIAALVFLLRWLGNDADRRRKEIANRIRSRGGGRRVSAQEWTEAMERKKQRQTSEDGIIFNEQNRRYEQSLQASKEDNSSKKLNRIWDEEEKDIWSSPEDRKNLH